MSSDMAYVSGYALIVAVLWTGGAYWHGRNQTDDPLEREDRFGAIGMGALLWPASLAVLVGYFGVYRPIVAYFSWVAGKGAARPELTDVTQPNLGPHRTPPTKCSECGGWNTESKESK